MNWIRRLATVFNVQPDEERLVALMVSFNFFRGIAYVTTQTAAYALFIEAYGVEGLPFTYLAIAFGLTLITLLYLRVTERLGFSRKMLGTTVALVISSSIFYLGLATANARWLIFLLPLWEYTFTSLSNIVLWDTAGRLFNVRQGKRLYGLIGSGRWLAVAISGLLIPVIVAATSTVVLLLIAAAGLLVSLLLLLLIMRGSRHVLAQPEPSATAKQAAVHPAGQPKSLLANRFVVYIFIAIIIWASIYYFLDNIFYNRAALQFPSADQLASFTGPIASIVGISVLIASMFFTGRFLNRFGIRAALVSIPVTILLIYGALVLTSPLGNMTLLFALVVLARIIENILSHAIFSPATRILIQPLPLDQRGQVLAAAEGIMEPFGIGITAVLLLGLTRLLSFDVIELALVVLIICALWLIVSLTLNRLYPAALSRALAKRRLGEETLEVADLSSLAVLREGLRDPHPEAVIYSLNLLQQLQPDSLKQLLAELMRHPAPRVRREVVARVARLELEALVPEVEALLEVEQAPEVREVALRTLAVIGDGDAFDRASAGLKDPDPLIRHGAMVGLIQSGRLDGMLLAGQKLSHLLDSALPEDRIEAARTLGEVGLRNLYQPLLPLLQDLDPRVRRVALLAAGKIQHKRLLPIIIDALSSSELQAAARVALVLGGTAALPDIQKAFDSTNQNPATLIRLVRVCGRIKGAEVVRFLQTKLDFPDPDIRTQIYLALHYCNYRAVDEAAIHDQLRQEAAYAVDLLTGINELGEEEPVNLLISALHQQFKQAQERMLLLLSFLYDRTSILRVRDALKQNGMTRRAFALEMIDTALPNDIKNYMLPLLEELPVSERLQRLSSTFAPESKTRDARILSLIAAGAASTTWLRACAMYAAYKLQIASAKPEIVKILQAPVPLDPLLYETAHWLLHRLDPASAVDKLTTGVIAVLSTIEKVIILKSVDIFTETPDEVLAEVASLVEEIELDADQKLFEKGDLGNSMYIVVSGKVRVHDGQNTLNFREQREVFGEMALLDPEPRVASVTAVEETLLLRLDQEPFYELMSDRIEVVRGIMRVITGNLRARVRDVGELRSQVRDLEDKLNAASKIPEVPSTTLAPASD